MHHWNNFKRWFMSLGSKFASLGTRFSSLSKKKKIVIAVLVFCLLLTGTGGAYVWHRLTDIEGQFDDVLNPKNPNGDDDEKGIIDIDEAFRDQKVLNILLMGFDRNAARDAIYLVYRPDTLMLASINLETGRVDVVSIPRDSLVPIYKRRGGTDKINHSFYYGWASTRDAEKKDALGLEYTLNTVSMALGGIPIHYYISIDMDGVVEAVNIMGGVWYDVPNDVYSRKGELLLNGGYQKLTGRQFLTIARNRQYAGNDYQRVQNQQDLLIATFNHFKQANSLIKAPQALLSMKNDIQTNLSMEQMASLALFATKKIDRANIHQHVMAGKFAYGRHWAGQKDVNIYWIIDNSKRAAMLKEIWGINVKVDPDIVLLPPRPKEPDEPISPGDDDDDDSDPASEPSDHDNPGGS